MAVPRRLFNDDCKVKDGNPWMNGGLVCKYGISVELEVESNSVLK